MSLVPTYVQMDDGRWYDGPVIGDRDRWFVCWDDDEPPELVVRAANRAEAEAQIEAVRRQIEKAGGRIDVRALGHSGSRNFGHGDRFEFRPAYQAWIRWRSTPPAALLLEHDGDYAERPEGDCVFYPREHQGGDS
jgi:hypothetical protein